MENVISPSEWPPGFSLDQERILNLLTGNRFYSNASAALRKSVLNAIDAVHRHGQVDKSFQPTIEVQFISAECVLRVSDNGDGMDRAAISNLFARVGATAADLQSGKGSVGEFGIGVISYFMAGDSFSVQTFDGKSEPIGLAFTRSMLAGGNAAVIPPTRTARGTTVEIALRDPATYDLLLKSFPEWCRDVSGLVASENGRPLKQGSVLLDRPAMTLKCPLWVERAHLAPMSGIRAWDAMSGSSTVSILYRGVFVQEFTAPRLWGIQGSIDVDPKHFQPKLNRESFVEGPFKSEVEGFLTSIHPEVLTQMAGQLSDAMQKGQLDKWNERRWATLWLSIPRSQPYASAAKVWDQLIRTIPAFELGVGNRWEPISFERVLTLGKSVYVAPLPNEKPQNPDVVNAALRLLRHTGRPVVRGLQPDRGWLKDAKYSFGTTADLIRSVFSTELPVMIPLAQAADGVIAEVKPVVTLFEGKPSIDLVRVGGESPPILRIASRLIINLDHPIGKEIVRDTLEENSGRWALIGIAARRSLEHLSQVAAVVKGSPTTNEPLGLVKRRFVRSLLS